MNKKQHQSDAAGTFVIPVSVADEQELYEAFDPSGLTLSESFKGYLADFMEDRKLGDRVCLRLTSGYRFDSERFRQAYGLHIEKLRQRSRREMRRQLLSALRLLGIGVVFVIIGLIFANTMGEVTAAIISTIGSFAIWEAAAVWIEEIPLLRAREHQLSLLAEAEIQYRKNDAN